MRVDVLALVLCLLPPVVVGQTLGEAAQKEKERRRNTGSKAAKVFTEEDLATSKPAAAGNAVAPASPPATPRTTPPRTSAPTPPSREAGSETTVAEGEGGGEASAPTPANQVEWRGRASEARARIRAAEEALKRAEQAARETERRRIVGMNPESDLERVAALRALDEATSELAAARQQVVELEEEARLGGVPPGWLRESSSSDRPFSGAGAPEAEWKARFRHARTRVAEAERAVATADEEAQRLPGVTTNWVESRSVTLQAQRKAHSDLAAARQALADLEEAARREGVPPGWLRE